MILLDGLDEFVEFKAREDDDGIAAVGADMADYDEGVDVIEREQAQGCLRISLWMLVAMDTFEGRHL